MIPGDEVFLDAPGGLVKSADSFLDPLAPQAKLRVTPLQETITAWAMPEMLERARMGMMYSCATPTANAFNFVAAMPTTRAELVLYNGEPQGSGKSYVIESAWVTTIVSPAASSALTLLGQLIPSGAAPTDNTAVLVTSRSGKPNYGGRALKAIANTAYAIASKWEVLGTTFGGAGAAQIGTSVIADLEGGWVIPPGGLLLLNVVSGTVATAAGLIGVTWSEMLLPII